MEFHGIANSTAIGGVGIAIDGVSIAIGGVSITHLWMEFMSGVLSIGNTRNSGSSPPGTFKGAKGIRWKTWNSKGIDP